MGALCECQTVCGVKGASYVLLLQVSTGEDDIATLAFIIG